MQRSLLVGVTLIAGMLCSGGASVWGQTGPQTNLWPDGYSNPQTTTYPNPGDPMIVPGENVQEQILTFDEGMVPVETGSSIRLDTELFRPLLDFQNRQSEKELLVLESQSQDGDPPTLLIGAQFRGSASASWSNRANKFNYLGRFPPDFQGDTSSDIRLLQANIGFVAHASPWVSGYLETLFSDVFSFPAFDQGSFQVRQAYVTLGNLNESPVYAFLGKKIVSFGHMGTLSPFSQSAVWHYFAPLAELGGVGYHGEFLHLSASAINGSRGIRVADSSNRGELNNFAANATLTVFDDQDLELQLGAGYLHGTIYDGQTAEHLDAGVTGPENGAWDTNLTARLGRIHLAGEYVSTLREWPVTGHQVIAYRTEGGIDLSPFWFSVSWSEGIQGYPSTEFEHNQQLVLGSEFQMSPNVRFSLEYIRSMGFAPLINITTVSDKSVRQNTILFGVTVVI